MQQRSDGGTLISHFGVHPRDKELRGELFAFQFGDGWQVTLVQDEIPALTGAGTEQQGRCVGPCQAAYREEIVF